MRMSEIVGLVGIFIGFALPVIGTIRSVLKSIQHNVTPYRITGLALFSYVIVIFFAGVSIALLLTINTFTNAITDVLNVLIGILTALIGILSFIYQTWSRKPFVKKEKSVPTNIEIYLDRVKADPALAGLQILSMNYPLNTTAIYVDVQLYIADDRIHESEAREKTDIDGKSEATGITPESAIQKYKFCIIKGDPGAGKTTLLKDLSLRLLTKQAKELQFLELPLYIELNAFARSDAEDLLKFASTKWDNSYRFPQDQAYIYFEEKLKNGKALLLLDGLDETFIGETMNDAIDSCSRVLHAIKQVKRLADNTESCIVVTVRSALEKTIFDEFIHDEKTVLNEFTPLALHGFRAEDITKFVNNWFTNQQFNPQGPIQATDLNAILSTGRSKEKKELAASTRSAQASLDDEYQKIQKLAENPLLLSLIAIVYQANLSLPHRRAELYHQCVETLLKRWDTTRDIHRHSELKEQTPLLLEEIAWYFHRKGETRFHIDTLQQVVQTFLETKEELTISSIQAIDEIAAETGLLVEETPNEYRFLHHTLQEYFVAKYAVRYETLELDRLVHYRHDPRWKEVILLYAAYTSDSSSLLQKLLEVRTDHLEEELFHTSLILVGQCLAQSTVSQPELRADITTRLLDVLQQTPYGLTRQQAARTLVEIGGPTIHQALLKILSKEQDSNISQYIADAFKELGDRSVVDDLLTLLSDEQIARPVRISLAKTLGSLGSLVELPVAAKMVDLLSNRELDVDVRASIAQALGSLHNMSIASALVALLANEELDVIIRVRVADAIGKLEDKAVSSHLVGLLPHESLDVRVRQSIAQALGTIHDKSAVPDLLTLLQKKDLDLNVGVSIVDAIGTIATSSPMEVSEIVSKLMQMLSNEELNINVRASIVQALGTLNDPRIAPNLVQLLSQEELTTNMRCNIAHMLGKLKDRSVAQSLVDLLSNQLLDVDVRSYIAQTLGDLQEKSVATQLVPLLGKKELDLKIRVNIAVALGKLGEDATALELIPLLANEELDAKLRVAIARTLGVLHTTAIVPNLQQLLSHEPANTDVRANILVTLAKLGDESVASELVQLLSNEQIDVKQGINIADVLGKGKLRKPWVAIQLVDLLKSKQLNSLVYLKIVYTIGQIVQTIRMEEGEAAVSGLIDLLSNSYSQSDDSVHLSIVSTPAAFAEPAAVSLEQLLCDPHLDSDIRKGINQTLDALGKENKFSESIQLFSSQEQIRRIAIVNVISKFVSDPKVVERLADLLKKNPDIDIPDSVHETIWKINRQVNAQSVVEE